MLLYLTVREIKQHVLDRHDGAFSLMGIQKSLEKHVIKG